MRSLELNIDLMGFAKMDTHPLDLPLLEKLAIRLPEDVVDGDSSIEMLFARVPLLHEVLLSEVSPSFIPLPWHQLTKFTGELYTLTQCLEALHRIPNITECAFSIVGSGHPDDVPLSHPNIQSLTLFESMSPWGFHARNSEILEFLTLPRLQTLEILDVEDFSEFQLDFFSITLITSITKTRHPPI
ncbi:hypothetical protein C8R44DRAFT_776255 [Mycena epipterygia]|nr:hypothetical protein C8R44DRAFT_776255 [Mycena epipterygia]